MEKNISQDKNQGLKIDKKTLIGITVLLVGILVFAGVLTQVVPTGVYDTASDGSIINGTYHQIERSEVGYSFWRVFLAPIEAFIFATSDAMTGVIIILFITIIGGTFLVLDKSGVLKYIMTTIVGKYEKKKYTLLAVMILACMALSSFAGILEESVTLVPLAVAISLSLGWDSFVGLGFSLVAIAFGYSAATFNPFNIGVVQSMAGLPMFSGLIYRIIVFAVIYAILAGFLIVYAKRIEKNPKKSLVYESDFELRKRFLDEEETANALANPKLGKATKSFVLCISAVFIITVLSFIGQRVIQNESITDLLSNLPLISMAILFTVGGLQAGKISGMKRKELFSGFIDGAKAILPCAPLILFIISITYVLKRGMIIDTILYYVYNFIKNLGPYESLIAIFFVICIFEFFIGSGTAKAFLLMPILLPLVDMLTIERQSLVLTFCLSDGLCNILFPTSGIMIIAIGLINIPYSKYMRFMWKLFVMEFSAAIILMLIAVALGYH
ncbi:MAG: hypothetical protein PUF31_02870 [Oscillospiraceae bacterium]|nr:hypothetical protein [Oscillospiraceae bacterium]